MKTCILLVKKGIWNVFYGSEYRYLIHMFSVTGKYLTHRSLTYSFYSCITLWPRLGTAEVTISLELDTYQKVLPKWTSVHLGVPYVCGWRLARRSRSLTRTVRVTLSVHKDL